jgi:glycosyltransferase involved in cell wall biosynthesis
MRVTARGDTTGIARPAHPAPEMLPRISIIVPVLDEEARIGGHLERLASLAGVHEVIVVDGGSRDRTVEQVKAAGGRAQILVAPRGRASQMNAGAAAATGDVLLFLHADVELPRDAPQRVSKALRQADVVAGAFRTWTVPDRTRRSWLSPLLHLADLRSLSANHTTVGSSRRSPFVTIVSGATSSARSTSSRRRGCRKGSPPVK